MQMTSDLKLSHLLISLDAPCVFLESTSEQASFYITEKKKKKAKEFF